MLEPRARKESFENIKPFGEYAYSLCGHKNLQQYFMSNVQHVNISLFVGYTYFKINVSCLKS